MDQKIMDGNTEVDPVAVCAHENGLEEELRGLFPLGMPIFSFFFFFLSFPRE